MPALQESLPSLEEQIALPDSQLAMMGIARRMTEVKREISFAEESLDFYDSYTPKHPGAAPHPEAGGMDHQDYQAELYEYTHRDEQREEDEERYSAILDEANNKLRNLEDDDDLIKKGDEVVVGEYASAERTRIQTEIEKQRSTQESTGSHTAIVGAAKTS